MKKSVYAMTTAQSTNNFFNDNESRLSTLPNISEEEFEKQILLFKTKHKQNRCNTKSMFYTEDMEFVNSLKIVEPKTNRLNLINKNDPHAVDVSNKLIQTFSERYPSVFDDTTGENLEKKKMSDEAINEKKRLALEEKITELKKKKSSLISKVIIHQKEVQTQNQDIDLLQSVSNIQEINTKKMTMDFKVSGYSTRNTKKTGSVVLSNFNSPNMSLNFKSNGREYDFEHNPMEVRSMLQKEEMKRNRLIQSKREEILLQKRSIDGLRKLISEIDAEIKMFETECTNIKENLLNHYNSLLSEGKETRKEGLIWIIKAIWALGYDVQMSKMPSFLDQEAIIFLIKYANFSLQYEIVKKSCEALRCSLALKNSMASNTVSKKTRLEKLFSKKYVTNVRLSIDSNVLISQQDEQTDPNSPRKNIKKSNNDIPSETQTTSYYVKNRTGSMNTINFKRLENENDQLEDPKILQEYISHYHHMLVSFNKDSTTKSTLGNWGKKALEVNKAKLIRDVLDKNTELDSETKKNYNTLNHLLETKELIKKKMITLKEQELTRICKEFLVNDYSRRFDVKQKVLYSALIGEDNAIAQVSKLKYEQKIYSQKLNDIQTFNVLKPNTRTKYESFSQTYI